MLQEVVLYEFIHLRHEKEYYLYPNLALLALMLEVTLIVTIYQGLLLLILITKQHLLYDS